jgi:hypothetical protein
MRAILLLSCDIYVSSVDLHKAAGRGERNLSALFFADSVSKLCGQLLYIASTLGH